jgi:hypothetical protein
LSQEENAGPGDKQEKRKKLKIPFRNLAKAPPPPKSTAKGEISNDVGIEILISHHTRFSSYSEEKYLMERLISRRFYVRKN